MKGNQAINGTFGRIWLNGDLLANTKSFEAKIKNEYEDIFIPEQLTPDYKLIGQEISGTMTLTKIDSRILRLLANDLSKGITPDIKLIGKVDDPTVVGHERIEITGVIFDEFNLLKFEGKKTIDEELPFKANGFKVIDDIDPV